MAWNFIKSGVFSVRSAYHMQREGSTGAASTSNQPSHRGWLKLWNADIQNKIKVHGWRLIQNGYQNHIIAGLFVTLYNLWSVRNIDSRYAVAPENPTNVAKRIAYQLEEWANLHERKTNAVRVCLILWL
uniref:Reverse transcriptase zinc-binding domain-containing protein n=1 Tax=Oryza barthii TaxID=65489 RepID=A0A0D3G3J6_9ORYZ